MESRKTSKFDIDIEIKDLLWEFLRRWRLIVAFVLVGALGLTMYQYRNDMNKTDVVTVKKSQAELEKAMGTQDLDEVTAAVALKRQLDEKSAYMETSELMHINPYEENAVILQYYVSADAADVAFGATEAYLSYVGNNHMESELVRVAKQQKDLYVNLKDAKQSLNISLQENNNIYCFDIKAIGKTMEDAKQLAEDAKKELQTYSATLKEAVGEHQLQLINETEIVMVDQDLAELQNWNATSIKTISNNLDSMKNEMTSDQISLYVYRTTVTEQSAETTVSTAERSVHISIKHMILGAIVGLILACAIIFVLYLFSSTLRNAEEVKTLYGIKVLGCVDDRRFQKRRVFGMIDDFVAKLQNGKKKKLSYEEEVQLACANIAIGMCQNNKKEIVLTGSMINLLPSDIIKAIVDNCEKRGIHVTIINAIQYDADALDTLAKVGSVVFVEKKWEALYDELYHEILVCKENTIDVLGMIVVGA